MVLEKWLHEPCIRFEGSGDEIVVMQSLHDVCAQAHPIAENSSSLGKSTALSAEILRWRSVLQSEPAVNFYTYEDEEVKSLKSKKMLLIVLQVRMNRVYNFL